MKSPPYKGCYAVVYIAPYSDCLAFLFFIKHKNCTFKKKNNHCCSFLHIRAGYASPRAVMQ